ncbi:MAG: ATP-binding response regulator [Marinifilaceae bacterium]
MRTKIAITLFIICAISAFTIYVLFESTLKIPINTDKNRKLVLISETLSMLYENEITGRSENLLTYKGLQNHIQHIDSLSQKINEIALFSTDSVQHRQITELKELFKQKKEYARVLHTLNKEINDSKRLNELFRDFEQIKDSIYTHIRIDTTIIETVDSSIVVENKKGGFLNMFNRPERQLIINNHVEVKTDTVISTNRDSLPIMLARTFSGYIKQDSISLAGLRKAQERIIINDKKIGTEIGTLLAEIEKEEFATTMRQLEEHKISINKTVNLITIIAAISIMIVILFVYSTFKEISAANRYRRQIEDAKLNLENLLHYREKLIYTLTHDIKTPLSAILGYITLSRDLHPQRRIENYLSNMELSANTIAELVTNLLDYSRLENNTLSIQQIVFDPCALFRDLKALFLPLAGQKKITLTFIIDNRINDSFMKGDPFRIKQVASNLISNAIKFTQQGGVTVSVQLCDNNFVVSVADTGKGIAPGELENIFKSFYQLADGKAQQAGTGLGLNICKGVAKLLNGDIKVSSTLGKGSVFTLTIPYTPAPRVAPTLKAGSSLRVLVVDDDIIQGGMLHEFLSSRKIYTDYESDSTKVLERLKKGNYSHLFTDIQMPDIDGFALYDAIRKAGYTLPVVAMSGNPQIVEQAQKRGFLCAIPKPFGPQQILSILQLEAISDDTVPLPPLQIIPFGIASLAAYCDTEDALKEIIDAFIKQSDQDIALLLQADSTIVKQTAHRMLNMFRQLNIEPMLDLLAQAEKEGIIDAKMMDIWCEVRTTIMAWLDEKR